MTPDTLLSQLMPPRFAWREGNRFELLVDGECYFERMLQAIDQAQHSIELEMYLAESGQVFSRFRDALLAAATRGVRVRVLLDGYGCKSLAHADRFALTQGGIQLAIYNELRWRKGFGNLFRNHRKLLLVDTRCAFVGGTGLTDEFMTQQHTPQQGWHEVMLQIEGPVTADWLTLFNRTWLSLQERSRQQHTASVPLSAGTQRGRVCASSGLRAHHVTRSLYQRIRHSKTRIWLATPYFLPALTLRYLLIRAAQKGLEVRILVPGEHTDHPAVRHASRRHYGWFLKRGVRIFEYKPRFIHAKLALCDQWVSLGSTNFDRWNLHWNLDANQEIASAELAADVEALFVRDFADSEEITLATWQQRAWRYRVMERVVGWMEALSKKLQ